MSPSAKKQTLPEMTREMLQRAPREKLIDIVLLLQEQNKQIAILEAKVAELERRLGLNSSNSSKPPSSDPPGAKGSRRKKRKKKKKRKQGAQPGHEPKHRDLLPVEQVDELVKTTPQFCEKCGGMHLVVDHDNPKRHQVWEIPPVEPTVREDQLLSACCQDCGHTTQAKLPLGVSPGNFGPRVQAIVSYLTGVGRLSKRLVRSMMKDLFGLDMCLGSVSACEKAISGSIEGPVEQAHQHVQEASILHADETSWWQKHVKFWLWVAVTSLVVVFKIERSRGKEAARLLLGRFKGILVTDRWGPYRVHKGLRQFCWAHLLRDFVGFSELNGKAGKIGQQLVDKTLKMFKWWHRVRDGTMSRKRFQRKMIKHRIEVENLLIDGEMLAVDGISGKCKKIFSESQHLWTFVDHEGVEPTNNTAEQEVRHAVIWRRTSFGTQGDAGSRFVERILTVKATCRRQGRNTLAYLTETRTAQLNHLPAPSLMPENVATR